MWNPGVQGLLSGLLAQLLKVILELGLRRRWRPSLFFANGGMPSSHAATVMALSLAIGHREGFNSSLFGISLVFSGFIIMEATGLRQEIGKQAQLLNEMMDTAAAGQKVDRERLRELVGHTWAEVAGGLLFGAVFHYWVWPWLQGPLS